MANGDTGAITKDPSKPKFWRFRNILAVSFVALVPLIGTHAWDFITSINVLADRVKDLETEQANNEAIWTAITDLKNKNTEREIDHRVTMRLFEREFGDPNRLRVYAAEEADPQALEDVRALLEEMAKRYHEDHPNVEKLPAVPPSVIQKSPNPRVQQMIDPVKPQQVPNAIDPKTFREQYEKRFPTKKK